MDFPARFKVFADNRQQPLGNPVRTLGAEAGQGVTDVLVGEPLDEGELVAADVHPWHSSNGSHTTGQASSTPDSLAIAARSASVVTGVIRSTMLLGKGTFPVTQAPSAGSLRFAKAVNILRATSPLSWMLSQDITAKGASPRFRRRASASVMRPNVVRCAAPGLEVVQNLGVFGVKVAGAVVDVVAAIRHRERNDPDRLGSHLFDDGIRVLGGNRYSRIEPMTRPSLVPSGFLTTSV